MSITTPSGQPNPLQAGEFQSSSRSNVVTWDFKGINPPGALYLTTDDKILVQGFSIAPVTVTFSVSGRLLTVDGIVVPFASSFTVAQGSFNFSIPLSAVEGFLLSVNVISNAVSRGQSYAAIYLTRGQSITSFIGQMLAADYCTNQIPMSWPNSGIRGTREGPGVLATVSVTSPGAGADWTFANTLIGALRLYHGTATLTTSAAAANRNVEVLVKDVNSVVVYRGSAAISIPASTTAAVSFTNGNTNTPVVTTDVLIPLPATCFIQAGGSLSVNTVNLQGGDQWSAIKLWSEQWVSA